MGKKKSAPLEKPTRYSVEVVGITDLNDGSGRCAITHIWCSGMVFGSQPKWITIDKETLHKLEGHPRVRILRVIPL